MTASVTRLHITPLNPDTLPTVLGSEISKLATNISYHTLQALPDSSYGYVDLPAMQAEKVKKKLNGAILKGKKIKVEEARPKKRKHTEETAEDQQEVEHNASEENKKKTKKERNVLSGHELSPDRKIKRGWTETKSSKSSKKVKKDKSSSSAKPQSASKYTEKDELLFRTKVPKNKSSQQDKSTKSKKKVDGGAEVIHEFEKSNTIPSFLRSESVSQNTTFAYKDGEGWVDNEGNVVEKESGKASKKRKAAQHGVESEVLEKQPVRAVRPTRTTTSITANSTAENPPSSSSSSSDQSESDDDSGIVTADDNKHDDGSDVEAEETSSSGSSTSDAASVVSLESATSDIPEKAPHPAKSTPTRLTIHPLEALFKKPIKPASSQAAASSQDNVKPSLEIQTSFSFFDQSNDQDNPQTMPMTPFSSQDLRSRESRSAAPTPDTAHPSRMSSIFNGEESEGELSEMEDADLGDELVSKQSQSSEGQSLQLPQTDFEKQFWEKRGENNRAWKARRRAVLKEKRQRENRARRPKNW